MKLEPDAPQKYCESHQDEFRIAEQVRAEYVVLSLDSLLPQIQVEPAEAKKSYDERQRESASGDTPGESYPDRSGQERGRCGKTESKGESGRGRRGAEEEPEQLCRARQGVFQDPGSAATAAIFATFGRGSMVKGFDDAVFSMKVGEISGPVETEYGYHIIRVTAINAGSIKTFDRHVPRSSGS